MSDDYSMLTNLRREVDGLDLKREKQVYWPIFEAVSNSLDAIDEAGLNDTQIQIKIVRDISQLKIDGNYKDCRVDGIEVSDNGCGFTTENLQSFREIKSEHKLKWNGKGTGRLFWLKAFDYVEITSVYEAPVKAGLKRYTRNFSFKLPSGIHNVQTKETADAAFETKIRLCGYKSKYEQPFRSKRFSSLKTSLLKHFMPNLILREKFTIKIVDQDDTDVISNSDIPTVTDDLITVKGKKFKIQHMRVRTIDPEGHYVYYCSGKRVVGDPERVTVGGIPAKVLKTESGEPYFYCGFVTSDFLDSHVNNDRTSFTFEDESAGDGLLDDTWISMKNIQDSVNQSIQNYLSKEIEHLQAKKQENIDQVFAVELAGFEYVREENPQLFERLPVDASPDQIKEKVAIAHFKKRADSRRDVEELISRISNGSEDAEHFERDCIETLPVMMDTYKADLAQYVLFRAEVLKLLNKILQRKESGEHFLEKALHSLIFPMNVDERKSPKKFSTHKHNLWLFDDRFAFFDYIASDLQLKSHKTLPESDDASRPDVCVYMFSEDINKSKFDSVVIVELKRPGRIDHEKDKDPVKQLYGYIAEINKRIEDYRGVEVGISKSVQFYCFAVCDVESDFVREQVIADHQMIPIHGDKGYFLYNSQRRAYIELLSPKALLEMAYERNKIFFRHLKLADDLLKLS